MFRSYWSIGLAALLAALPLSTQQSGNARSGQSSAKESSEISQSAPAPIVPALNSITNKRAKTRKDQSDPYGYERDEREKRDLVAQEESAKWAQANFWAIVLQTLLAGGALAAILYDIGQGRKSAETQSRAYVTMGNTEIRRTLMADEPEKWFLDVEMDNKGQTPAFVSLFDIKVGWRRKGIAEDIIDESFSKIRDIQVVIASAKSFGIWVEIENGFSPKPLHQGDTLVIRGTIEYVDIFNKRRTTKYGLYADKDGWRDGDNTVVVHTDMLGNTCT